MLGQDAPLLKMFVSWEEREVKEDRKGVQDDTKRVKEDRKRRKDGEEWI